MSTIAHLVQADKICSLVSKVTHAAYKYLTFYLELGVFNSVFLGTASVSRKIRVKRQN